MAKIYGFNIYSKRVVFAKMMARHLHDPEGALKVAYRDIYDNTLNRTKRLLGGLPADMTEEDIDKGLLEVDKKQLLRHYCLNNVDDVLERWFFEFFVVHQRRWEAPLTEEDSIKIISPAIDDSVFDTEVLIPKLASMIILTFNDLFGELIPARSWREIHVRWTTEEPNDLSIMMGEDYRVRWFMENMVDKNGYQVDTCYRRLLPDIDESHHNEEVVIRIPKRDFKKLGIVDFSED